MLKVAIVDDSLLIQRSLGRLLGAVPGVEVVGHAEDAIGALELIEAVRPDVMVLDVNLARGDSGMTVLRQLRQRWPRVRVVVLTNVNRPPARQDYLGAGADVFFDKSTEFMQARDWIQSLVDAEPPADPSGRAGD